MLPGPVEALAKLVETPSVSSSASALDQSNAGVIALLAEWSEALGFEVEIQEVAPGKQNLIATLGAGEDGVLLCGHTDTVPFDEARWTSHPLELVERGGKLFGRGSVDMKGFFPAALAAVERAQEGVKLRKPVTIVATSDEETTMDGARALLERSHPPARYCVVGEPTSMRPISAHKGILMERLTIVGKSGHSSNPALGVNAIGLMHRAISALTQTCATLSSFQDPRFEVPAPTLNLGRIEGGDSPTSP